MRPALQLKAKLLLERELLDELAVYNKATVREFMRDYGLDAAIPDMQLKDAELAGILEKHYTRTAETFAPVVPEKLPEDVAMTSEEAATITMALAAFFSVSAIQSAAEINGTTQRAMDAAVTKAIPTTDGLRESAAVAGAEINRDLKGRAPTIAATETQLAAETTKATTAEVLLGRAPGIEGGTAQPAKANKTWFSVGDSKVREAHLIADGEEVRVDEPFTVDGEQLRYPGDSSLGASSGNIINCRCIADYDTAAIAEERRAAQ